MLRVALVVAVGSLGLLIARYLERRSGEAATLERQVEADLNALREHLFGQ
jgi:hypothetical protein